ncbi:MAG: hypothetical protein WDZ49_15960 [Litorilinea sp.]
MPQPNTSQPGLSADSPSTRRAAHQLITAHTGVVITVYLGADADTPAGIAAGIALLGDTVEAYAHVIAAPRHIVLSVDGPGPGVTVARQVAATYGVPALYAPTNGGKLAAARLGAEHLLQDDSIQYIALVDQDGDHFANELLNLGRMAHHVASETGRSDVLVMGSRLSKARGLGMLRADGEELANRILLDALHYHAAVTATPLPLQYALPLESVPDFHAGYKLFSRAVAVEVFTGVPNLADCPPATYFRHAIEAVMVVESLAAGATLATVSRRTYDEQPMSIFAQINRAQLTADLIIWPCKRLAIPAPFVAQWLTNHLPCMPLTTLLPHGREELLNVARLVHAAFQLPPPADNLPRPRFI